MTEQELFEEYNKWFNTVGKKLMEQYMLELLITGNIRIKERIENDRRINLNLQTT